MSTPQDVIAARLRSHWGPLYPKGETECCGQEVLDALTEAGYAVVRLPEPIERCDCGGGIWPSERHDVASHDGYVYERDGLTAQTPEAVISYAAALIAAAQAVQR